MTIVKAFHSTTKFKEIHTSIKCRPDIKNKITIEGSELKYVLLIKSNKLNYTILIKINYMDHYVKCLTLFIVITLYFIYHQTL